MNTPLRRVSLVVMGLIVLLLGQATWVQVVKADEYRANSANQRVLPDEYARQRGQISAGGEVLASSVATDDRLRYLRRYSDGPMYAPVTGYYSQTYGTSGIERSMDPILNGTDDRLFVRRISDAVTGRDPAGGNVALTIDPKVQRAAYDAMSSKNFQGSVVAIRPQTGEILAMVSTPSFDPNPLASHDGTVQTRAWNRITDAEPPELSNRAINELYPPGSTFKLVNAAAALEAGMITPQSPVTAAGQITLPDSTTTLENYDGETCGSGPTVTFAVAFAKSCNAPFAQLADQIGADRLRSMAQSLGFNNPSLQVPLPVQASQVGALSDGASLAQSGIGQRDVRLTPLENAQITATIANGGVPMAPHLVAQVQGQDLSVVDTTEPDSEARAMSSATATTLTQLMLGSENSGTGSTSGGKIAGVQLASKTGTAEWGASPKTNPPHTWYNVFGPVPNPQIAVSVLVERGGNRGDDATGSSVAGPIGRSVIAALLSEGRSR